MYIPTRDEIRAAYQQGGEATIQLFEHLALELQSRQDQLQALQDQLNEQQKQQQTSFQRWSQEAPHQKPEKAGQQKEPGKRGQRLNNPRPKIYLIG